MAPGVPVRIDDVHLHDVSEAARLGLERRLCRQPAVIARQTDEEDRLDPVVGVVGRARPGRADARATREVVDRRVNVVEQKHRRRRRRRRTSPGGIDREFEFYDFFHF